MATSTTEMQTFSGIVDGSLCAVQACNVDGAPWYKAVDIARGVGYLHPQRAISKLPNFQKTSGSELLGSACPESDMHTIFVDASGKLALMEKTDGASASFIGFVLDVVDKVLKSDQTPEVDEDDGASDTSVREDDAMPSPIDVLQRQLILAQVNQLNAQTVALRQQTRLDHMRTLQAAKELAGDAFDVSRATQRCLEDVHLAPDDAKSDWISATDILVERGYTPIQVLRLESDIDQDLKRAWDGTGRGERRLEERSVGSDSTIFKDVFHVHRVLHRAFVEDVLEKIKRRSTGLYQRVMRETETDRDTAAVNAALEGGPGYGPIRRHQHQLAR